MYEGEKEKTPMLVSEEEKKKTAAQSLQMYSFSAANFSTHILLFCSFSLSVSSYRMIGLRPSVWHCGIKVHLVAAHPYVPTFSERLVVTERTRLAERTFLCRVAGFTSGDVRR